MSPEETAIRERDAQTGELWFVGPKSFTSLAARDRRELLRMLEQERDAYEKKTAALEAQLTSPPALVPCNYIPLNQCTCKHIKSDFVGLDGAVIVDPACPLHAVKTFP